MRRASHGKETNGQTPAQDRAEVVGLEPGDTRLTDDPGTARLVRDVEADGGAVLASYREPFGGTAVLLSALPIDRVEPTPFQRDPSEPHVKRLMTVIETLGRFLDPIVAIRHDDALLDAER